MHELPVGFLLINKPVDWTSFDVVGFLRKKIRQSTVIASKAKQSHDLSGIAASSQGTPRNDKPKPKNIKVGHAGTLDPFATGLLIVGVGREATKRLDEFKNLPKTYVAGIHLGATSDTDDVTGVITKIERLEDSRIIDPQTIETTLKTFLGKQKQIPPMYSAKSIGGVRLYKLARQGKTVERQPEEIEIYDIKLLGYTWPLLEIEVTCSAGTYVRTIAHDIGEKLGTGAYCETLCRTKIGPYSLADAQTLDQL